MTCDVCGKPVPPNPGRGRPRERHKGACTEVKRMQWRGERLIRRARELAERMRQEVAA